MADAVDSRSTAESQRGGSSPSLGIIFKLPMNFRKNKFTRLERTTLLLNICEILGIDGIAIDDQNPLIPASMQWTHYMPETSVFGVEKRIEGWPGIWRACEILEEIDPTFRNYCGNSNQKQVQPRSLISGTYLLERGKWLKVT